MVISIFFGFSEFKNSDNHLFIGVVRDPYDWVNSFYKTHPEINDIMLKDKHSFIINKVSSRGYYPKSDLETLGYDVKNIDLQKKYTNGEIIKFYEIKIENPQINNDIYNNIFEMRKLKMKYLLHIVPKKVNNYILIKYENFLENYDKVLDKIGKKFNLERKNDNFYEKVITYKGKKNSKPFNPKHKPKFYLNKEIKKHLDKNLEKKLGYDI